MTVNDLVTYNNGAPMMITRIGAGSVGCIERTDRGIKGYSFPVDSVTVVGRMSDDAAQLLRIAYERG